MNRREMLLATLAATMGAKAAKAERPVVTGGSFQLHGLLEFPDTIDTGKSTWKNVGNGLYRWDGFPTNETRPA